MLRQTLDITHGSMTPVVDDVTQVGRRMEQEVVPPLIETDVQGPILVHPEQRT